MGKNLNHFKKCFKNFCKQTTVDGFAELYNAHHQGWTVFWTILLMVAIGMTSYQVIGEIQQFMDESSNTRVEPANQNDMYPPIKICPIHWVYWLDWEKAYSLKFTRESLLYGMSYLTNVYSANLFDVQLARDQFQYSMTLNNFSRIQQFYKSIALKFPLVNSSINSSNLFDQIDVFVSNLWGPLLCYSTSGDVIKRSIMNKKGSDYAVISFLIKVQSDWILPLKDNNLTVNEYNYYISRYLVDTGFYIDKKDGKYKDFSTYSSPFLLYVDGYSQDYLPVLSDQYDLFTLVVKVKANRFRPSSKLECLENQKYVKTNSSYCPNYKTLYPDIVCQCSILGQAILSNTDYPKILCRNNFYVITAQNNSAVILSSENFQVTPNGSLCWINETAIQFQDSFPKCLYPCEVWSYSFSFVQEKFGNTAAQSFYTKRGTSLRVIYPNDYDIYIIVEVEHQTWEDFIANIGGVLGVWTGASLLSIFQLFYICCFVDKDSS